MQSESYESAVDFSPYYLAYIIEKFLHGPDRHLPGQLLLAGLWQDPALLSQDPAYIDALLGELAAASADQAPDEAAKTLALVAFVTLLRGDSAAAQPLLAQAEAAGARAPEALRYLDAVHGCLANPARAYCSATALIPPE
jgi:hypothetical protein